MNKPQDTRRLLVLDDENDVAATICMMAATAGFDADHTDDTGSFFEKLAAWSPTHVMVDLQLGARDGIEVIHQLAEINCQSALIIISGLGGRILDSSVRAATENGLLLTGALVKPFSRSALLDLLAVEVPKASSNQGSSSSSVSVKQLNEALRSKVLIAHFQPKIPVLTLSYWASNVWRAGPRKTAT